MANWIEIHGFECLIACYAFSMVTSVIPPYGTPRFFSLWAYNIIALLGANAGNLVKHTPAGQRIENLVGENNNPK